MDRNGVSRRKVLALLAAAGSAVAINSARPTRNPANDGNVTQPPNGTPGGELQYEPDPPEYDTSVRLEEHGGAIDGTTDDTEAFMSALDAASPGGTVRLPPGDILIGSGRDDAITIGPEYRGVSIIGAGPGSTRLKMAPGHDTVHRGIVIVPSQRDPLGGISIRNLTLDGRGLEQNYNIANGIEVENAGGVGFPLEIRNCVVRDWATNGLQLREPGTRIYDSSIVVNGRQQEAMTGRDGHGVAAFIGDNPNGQTLIEDCLLQGNTGAGADNKGGNMTIRGCVIDDCGYGVKQNDTTGRQVIENTRISNLRTEPGIYNIPSDGVGGDLVLNDVCIERATDPALLLPAGGSITGDRILIRRTNTDQTQPAGVVVKDEGRRFDVGEMIVYDTAGGSAVHFENCTGSIDRLVHSGNPEGVGPLSDVTVGALREDGSADVAVPNVEDVGASSQY